MVTHARRPNVVKSHCASARWQKPALADLANSIKTETCRKDLRSVKGVRTKDSHGSHLQACGQSLSAEDPLIAGGTVQRTLTFSAELP